MIRPVDSPSILPQGIMQGAGGIHVGNSALFLFTPRNIVHHVKRPMVYNFNNEMTEAISEHIMNHPSSHNPIGVAIKAAPSMHSAIIPAAQGGIDVATEAYSDHWMFVLIIDEDAGRNMMLSNKIMTRSILIGMCSAEPIAQIGFSSATPEQFVNPNCQLIVTRQLQMTKYNSAAATGFRSDTRTPVDNNIARFDPNIWGANFTGGVRGLLPPPSQEYYSLTPGEVHGVVTNDGLGGTSSILSAGNSLNVKGSISINAPLESPTRQMREILKAFTTGSAQNLYGSSIGQFDEGVSMMNTETENIAKMVRSALDESRFENEVRGRETIQDMTNITLTIGMVMAQYRPRIIPITTPKNSKADIIPQGYTSINNVFSSLVCNVIPTYLNSVGLSTVSFMYNSAQNAFKVLHIEAALNISQPEMKFKWEAFQHLVATDLFQILYNNGGHFDLQVQCSVNGTTDVVLNFLDNSPLPPNSIYQENSVLGGIVSPLIGSGRHLEYNSVQLNNLIDRVSENSTSNPRLF